VTRLALLTSNCSTRDAFFRAGGIRFIADVLPFLSRHYDVDFYVAGPRDDEFEFRGATVHIIKSRKIPFVDKRFLPRLDIRADGILFLDYVAALSRNSAPKSAVVFHHLAKSFYDESPALYRKYFGRRGMRYLSFEDKLLRLVRKKTRRALAVSDVTVAYLRELGFSVDIVGNGIDTELYRYVPPERKDDYAVVIGRLVNYKRVEWALRLSREADIPLKVIGTGPLSDALRSAAPDNVEFLGYVGEREKIRILSRARFLFAFSAFEGFDIPVIESMAVGTIPIMSDIRAHRFIVRDNPALSRLLFTDVNSAADFIHQVQSDSDLYAILAHSGRRLVETGWNASVVADRYLSALEAILSG